MCVAVYSCVVEDWDQYEGDSEKTEPTNEEPTTSQNETTPVAADDEEVKNRFLIYS